MKQVKSFQQLVTALVLILAVTLCVQGKVIYVDCEAAGSDDGTSWADAYPDLQDALDDATSGDEIRVADECTYKPSKRKNPGDPRSVTFQLITGVILKGGYAGNDNPLAFRDPAVYITTLSGDIGTVGVATDNCYNVVSGQGGILDGFTITGGYANGGRYDEKRGGGLNAPMNAVRNCIFENNYALCGGAMHCVLSPQVIHCEFRNNIAGKGGALYIYAPSTWIERCTFDNNQATSHGGAVYTKCCKTVFQECVFEGNGSTLDGGAMYFDSAENPLVERCIFFDNSAVRHGGTAYISGKQLRFINNLAYYNSALRGGVIYNYGTATKVRQCTLADNAAQQGGAIYNYCGYMVARTTVLWGNTAPTGAQIHVVFNSVTVTYSDVQGGWPGTGNISANPLFTAAYRLQAGSPCIDAGDNGSVIQVPVDLDGNQRMVDDPATPDTGWGLPPVVDMGACEFQGS